VSTQLSVGSLEADGGIRLQQSARVHIPIQGAKELDCAVFVESLDGASRRLELGAVASNSEDDVVALFQNPLDDRE
jgi:hypothetical protein